ncbi:hypothetical protein HBI56_199440 [Parastagonospora nodorum]|nr:hypothetical protein HBH51_199520 [Parastagonospora nodorum]KAH3963961.1 hypothetical protein HBH52_214100 [Parastagonospora nodorum]KAH3992873.1 hypothetical protein HBI10_209530 [Parastagonospora nodorum]KAH4010737.1 hypothetical protein HBI13_206670 [Parastagonospora nodorum]KAH4042821.1 hypothetical protein HBH49_243200 [Parastagonospora nodorum]
MVYMPTSPTSVAPEITMNDMYRPRKNVASYRGSVKVTVGDGDEQQTFDVHESLIMARSAFFKALSGNWTEAKSRHVNLPEDDPQTFENYVHHLYTNTLAVKPSPVPDQYVGREEKIEPAKLYVFAEKIQDTDTKDAVVKAMAHSSQLSRYNGKTYGPNLGVVSLIYAGTAPWSPMRKLLVDIYTYQANAAWLTRDEEESPSDFLRELALEPSLTILSRVGMYRHTRKSRRKKEPSCTRFRIAVENILRGGLQCGIIIRLAIWR